MIVFQKRLKETREKRGLTQEQLGKEIFLTKAEVSNYETGKRKAPLVTVIEIARFLEVDFLWLVGMELDYEKDNDKIVNLSELELKIIDALRRDSGLYEEFLENPERTIANINRALKKK